MIVLGLDIDTTVVTHAYPEMGEDIGAIPWLKQALMEHPEVRIMLNTMRSGPDLELSRQWLEDRGVPVWAMNSNPSQHLWTQSPKPHAHVYVDDRAVGTPLREDRCVDWEKFGPMLLEWLDRFVAFRAGEV